MTRLDRFFERSWIDHPRMVRTAFFFFGLGFSFEHGPSNGGGILADATGKVFLLLLIAFSPSLFFRSTAVVEGIMPRRWAPLGRILLWFPLVPILTLCFVAIREVVRDTFRVSPLPYDSLWRATMRAFPSRKAVLLSTWMDYRLEFSARIHTRPFLARCLGIRYLLSIPLILLPERVLSWLGKALRNGLAKSVAMLAAYVAYLLTRLLDF